MTSPEKGVMVSDMPFQTPKYEIPLHEFAVWSEYESDGTLSSGGMCHLESFEQASSYKDKEDNVVELLYIIKAATWEEANAINELRLYGSQYKPQGKSVTCPKCLEFQMFPENTNDCPLCGREEEENDEEA